MYILLAAPLCIHSELPKPNDIEKKEGASSMPKTPAWRCCLMRCLSLIDGWYSAYKQGKKCWCFVTYRQIATRWKKQNLFTCSKCCGEGKEKKRKKQNKTKETSDHHSHLFLSEYQALWPTSLLGPLPGRHPILIAGSTGHRSTSQESYWCSAVTRLDW